MKLSNAIRDIMTKRGFTQRALIAKMGGTSSAAIGNMLARPNGVRSDKLIELAEAMDCEIVIRSKLKDKQEWVVTLDD